MRFGRVFFFLACKQSNMRLVNYKRPFFLNIVSLDQQKFLSWTQSRSRASSRQQTGKRLRDPAPSPPVKPQNIPEHSPKPQTHPQICTGTAVTTATPPRPPGCGGFTGSGTFSSPKQPIQRSVFPHSGATTERTAFRKSPTEPV